MMPHATSTLVTAVTERDGFHLSGFMPETTQIASLLQDVCLVEAWALRGDDPGLLWQGPLPAKWESLGCDVLMVVRH